MPCGWLSRESYDFLAIFQFDAFKSSSHRKMGLLFSLLNSCDLRGRLGGKKTVKVCKGNVAV